MIRIAARIPRPLRRGSFACAAVLALAVLAPWPQRPVKPINLGPPAPAAAGMLERMH